MKELLEILADVFVLIVLLASAMGSAAASGMAHNKGEMELKKFSIGLSIVYLLAWIVAWIR
jgi:uncharacterized protein HemY